MFKYVVMRKDLNEGGNTHHWYIWDVEASNINEAIESAADVPGDYVAYEVGDPTFAYVGVHSELKISPNTEE